MVLLRLSLAWQGLARTMQQWSTIEDTKHGSIIQPEAWEGGSKEGLANSNHGQCINTSSSIFDLQNKDFCQGSGDFPIRGMGLPGKRCPLTTCLTNIHGAQGTYRYNHRIIPKYVVLKTPLLLWMSFESISLKQCPFCPKNGHWTRTPLASFAKVGIKKHSIMITLGITILSRPVACIIFCKLLEKLFAITVKHAIKSCCQHNFWMDLTMPQAWSKSTYFFLIC